MAYTANEYRVQIRGSLVDGAEHFVNTWSVLDVVGGQSVTELASPFHTFYDACAAEEMSSHTSITSARVQNLNTLLVTDLTWATVVGDDLADPMPPQLCVRISLTGPSNLNGGPFIPGWSKNAGDENGLYAHPGALATAAHTLCTSLVTAGWQLRIDRPTVSGTVAALSGRVGKRFDIIRKRANEIGEAYSPFAVT